MKKLCFLFFAIFATANIYAQTYTISFAGTGAATTVDSVKVENLTQSTTVKWHAGDVLQLQLTNGIDEKGINNENLQVYPNPMQRQAEISFYAKQAGNAKISIYDIAGKEILRTEGKLLQGIQKYQLTGLKQGVYFINISGDAYFYTAKLISQNATPGEAKIKYIGNEKPEAVVVKLKSTKATITMPYTTGDNLRFTGYKGSYYAIVIDIPSASKTITFTYGGAICSNFTITHIAGNVAPVTKTVTYGTVLTSLSGTSKCWLTQNLGATHQATAVTDTTEASAGWYWQFNRKQGFKHDGIIRTPNTIWDSLINENSDWITINDPCTIELGDGWRIPTIEEWAAVYDSCSYFYDIYNSIFKIHAAGILVNTDGSLYHRDGFYSSGGLWSSLQFDSTNGYGLNWVSTLSHIGYISKPFAFCLRCIRD